MFSKRDVQEFYWEKKVLPKIKITILGTTAGVPTKERAHTAICVRYESAARFTCLFDCGEGTQRQMLIAGIGINSVDRIFVTHWHGDHCFGIPGIVDTMGFDGRTRPLYIHGPEARKMRSRSGPLYPMGKFKMVTRDVPFRGERIFEVFRSDECRVLSVPAKHSIPAVSYAFIENDRFTIDMEKAARHGFSENDKRFGAVREKGSCVIEKKRVTLEEISNKTSGRKVVYSGDTEVCDNLVKIAKGADLLIQDCTYVDSPGGGRQHCHASFPEVVKMTETLGVKKVVLTHFSRRYRDFEMIRRTVEAHSGFEMAEDFYSVTL